MKAAAADGRSIGLAGSVLSSPSGVLLMLDGL